jgi:tRNA threonylcarbamoyladenosine biosynthesis protein TsaE
MQFLSTSEKQTFNFARALVKKLKGGEVIGLIGKLGAGKTVFTKGLAKGLSVKKTITSPTFVLMRVYTIQRPHVKLLVHIDAYRLKSAKDLLAIGVSDYFSRPDTIIIIEWADKIKKILPKKTRFITIAHNKNNSRIINW